MIRIIVRTCDAAMAANVGGEVVYDYQTFDVSLPEVEAFLRAKTNTYAERRVQGIELLEEPS